MENSIKSLFFIHPFIFSSLEERDIFLWRENGYKRQYITTFVNIFDASDTCKAINFESANVKQ